jgi:hypothetical protein
MLRPEQYCAWMAASWPWAPSLASLRATLLEGRLGARREQGAPSGPPKRRRGRPRKVRPPQDDTPASNDEVDAGGTDDPGL